MGVLLSVRGVSKDFGGLPALDKVEISVKEGAITAIIGPNGTNKTAPINIITGVYDPSEGSVFFGERRIDRLPPHKIVEMGLLCTFQLTKLFKGMSVLENVMVGRHTRATASTFVSVVLNSRRVRHEEVQIYVYVIEMLKLSGLERHAHEPAGNLPHGQQRSLELARSMATSPKLILLDEPAAGLNPHEEDMLHEVLRTIINRGTIILLIEHHMRLVMSISDWVNVLDLGRKIAEGTPGELGKDPPVVKAYLGKEY